MKKMLHFMKTRRISRKLHLPHSRRLASWTKLWSDTSDSGEWSSEMQRRRRIRATNGFSAAHFRSNSVAFRAQIGGDEIPDGTKEIFNLHANLFTFLHRLTELGAVRNSTNELRSVGYYEGSMSARYKWKCSTHIPERDAYSGVPSWNGLSAGIASGMRVGPLSMGTISFAKRPEFSNKQCPWQPFRWLVSWWSYLFGRWNKHYISFGSNVLNIRKPLSLVKTEKNRSISAKVEKVTAFCSTICFLFECFCTANHFFVFKQPVFAQWTPPPLNIDLNIGSKQRKPTSMHLATSRAIHR